MQLKLEEIPGLAGTVYAGKAVQVEDAPNGHRPLRWSSLEMYVNTVRELRTKVTERGVDVSVRVGDQKITLGEAYVSNVMDLRGRFVASVHDFEIRAAQYESLNADPTERIDLRREINRTKKAVVDVYGSAGSDLVTRLETVYARLDSVKNAYEEMRERTQQGAQHWQESAAAALQAKEGGELRAAEKNISAYLSQSRPQRIQEEFADKFSELRKLRSQVRSRAEALEMHNEVLEVVHLVHEGYSANEYDAAHAGRLRETIQALQSKIASSSQKDRFKNNMQAHLSHAYDALQLDDEVFGLQQRVFRSAQSDDTLAIDGLEAVVASLQGRIAGSSISLSYKSQLESRLVHVQDSLTQHIERIFAARSMLRWMKMRILTRTGIQQAMLFVLEYDMFQNLLAMRLQK